jgi:hypothetical protein
VAVEIGIALAVLAVVMAAVAIRRSLAPASSDVDLGQVSQSWLTQARANKSEQ